MLQATSLPTGAGSTLRLLGCMQACIVSNAHQHQLLTYVHACMPRRLIAHMLPKGSMRAPQLSS